MLKDGFPKVILRTDISKFYESIPHNQLINKIDENSLLSFPSKKVIKQILNQYWNILVADGIKNANDERIGLPRGIGISAFLSELYLKDLDSLLKSMPNVTYYARYVDDIIIIFTPENRKDTSHIMTHKSEVKKIIEKFSLQINNRKTQIIDLKNGIKQNYNITYLGYKFTLSNQKPLIIKMSDKKYNRYKSKIKISFKEFRSDIIKYTPNTSKANNKLVQRIKILTSNFRLFSRKDNVLIGIYFSNEFLTKELEDLVKLDKFLRSEIKSVSAISSKISKNKLDTLSFTNGFNNKHTVNFNFNQKQKRGAVKIDKIINIWKDL